MGMYFERSKIQSPNVEDPLETMTLESKGSSVTVSSFNELPLEVEAETPLVVVEGASDEVFSLGLKISFF